MSEAARADGASAPSPWRGAELLDRAIGYTRASLCLVTPGLLSAPTPCAGWDLGQLLSHLDDSLATLHEAGSGGRVGLTAHAPARPGAGDPVAALRRRACDVLADWSADRPRPWARGDPAVRRTPGRRPGNPDVVVAGRPLSAPVLAGAGALEVAVHGWDIATACGIAHPLPEGLAVDLLRVAPVLVTDLDRPGRFGDPVQPGDAGSAGDRLLAFLGRVTPGAA